MSSFCEIQAYRYCQLGIYSQNLILLFIGMHSGNLHIEVKGFKAVFHIYLLTLTFKGTFT